MFFQKSLRLFALDFGAAEDGRDIAREIRQRMGPSLAIALPVFLVGLAVNISFALMMAFFRATYLDFWGVVLCVGLMSISTLFYIIGGQYLASMLWHLVPISGYAGGFGALKFVILPVVIGVVSGIGAGSRWYRTLFLEEMGKDYVRTARAKGLSERAVLFRHVLSNALIPILTGCVAVIPLLFMGSLLMESFFGIPGLGSYTIDAIQGQDFAVVRSMVFIGSALYILGAAADRPVVHRGRSEDPAAMSLPVLPVVLWTDALLWLLVAALASYAWRCARRPHLAAPWARVFRRRVAAVAAVVLAAYVLVALADSIHFRARLERQQAGTATAYSGEVLSLLDVALPRLRTHGEKTYSAPFATRLYARELVERPDGSVLREYPQAALGRRAARRTRASAARTSRAARCSRSPAQPRCGARSASRCAACAGAFPPCTGARPGSPRGRCWRWRCRCSRCRRPTTCSAPTRWGRTCCTSRSSRCAPA